SRSAERQRLSTRFGVTLADALPAQPIEVRIEIRFGPEEAERTLHIVRIIHPEDPYQRPRLQEEFGELAQRHRLLGLRLRGAIQRVTVVLVDDPVADRAEMRLGVDARHVGCRRIDADAGDLDLAVLGVRQVVAAHEHGVNRLEQLAVNRRESRVFEQLANLGMPPRVEEPLELSAHDRALDLGEQVLLKLFGAEIGRGTILAVDCVARVRFPLVRAMIALPPRVLARPARRARRWRPAKIEALDPVALDPGENHPDELVLVALRHDHAWSGELV